MTGLGKTRSAPTENSTGARNTIVTCDECESRLVVTLEKARRLHSASDTYAGCSICGNAIPVTQIPGAGPSDRVCDVEALDDDEELDRPYDDLDHAPENIELSENGDANDGRDEIVAAIEGSLETADLDYVSGTVRLEFQWMDIEVDGCYRSSRELRAEVGLFAARLAERMRLPLARLDLSDLVAAALEGSEVDALLASAPLGRDAQILVTVEDLAKLSESSRIRLDLEEINDAIIRELAVRPHLMYELHPRKFEQLVAELFRDMGYDVVLTPPSGDGGRDIKAFRKDACGTLLTLIECKRYSRTHPVGVALVRSLYGVLERERASHALVATTSRFTKGARAFQQDVPFRLSLADYDQLAGWCVATGPRGAHFHRSRRDPGPPTPRPDSRGARQRSWRPARRRAPGPA